nr:hypothetical protein BaRGS_011492 [Batillaria attramentaria]
MKILIEHGATVDFFTHEEDVDENSRALGYLTIEPLNLAIENNHVDCLRLLLDSGARPDHKYFMGYEINLVPLEHLECLEILLQYGADPNVFNRSDDDDDYGDGDDYDDDVDNDTDDDDDDDPDDDGWNLPAARKLLAYGAKVDIQGPTRFEQKTALHYAIASGNGAILHVLLRHGASPRRPPEYKYAAMHAAVLSDRPDFCEMLLKWGAQLIIIIIIIIIAIVVGVIVVAAVIIVISKIIIVVVIVINIILTAVAVVILVVVAIIIIFIVIDVVVVVVFITPITITISSSSSSIIIIIIIIIINNNNVIYPKLWGAAKGARSKRSDDYGGKSYGHSYGHYGHESYGTKVAKTTVDVKYGAPRYTYSYREYPLGHSYRSSYDNNDNYGHGDGYGGDNYGYGGGDGYGASYGSQRLLQTA